MAKLNFLSPLTVSYLTGVSSSIDALKPKIQKNTLELFRRGEVFLELRSIIQLEVYCLRVFFPPPYNIKCLLLDEHIVHH